MIFYTVVAFMTSLICALTYIYKKDGNQYAPELIMIGTFGAIFWPVVWVMLLCVVLRNVVQKWANQGATGKDR